MRILVRDSSRENEGNNLHIFMRMHTKSLMSRYEVIIEDAECPKVHIVWIIVIGKRKKMLGFEPVMLGCVALMRWYDVDVHEKSIQTQDIKTTNLSEHQNALTHPHRQILLHQETKYVAPSRNQYFSFRRIFRFSEQNP